MLEKLIKVLRKLRKIFYQADDYSGLYPLTEAEYRAQFSQLNDAQRSRAFEMILDTRKFEIDLYWRRATYFWAFIASAFAGYIFLARSGNENQFVGFVLICVGFLLSVAWLCSNSGSKKWQRHWERHLDLLEDDFVGPLYKSVNLRKSFSVSKINNIVSSVFCGAWLLVGIDHLNRNNLINFNFDVGRLDWGVVIALISTVAALCSMVLGAGRGRFGFSETIMYKRKVAYFSDEDVAKKKATFDAMDSNRS